MDGAFRLRIAGGKEIGNGNSTQNEWRAKLLNDNLISLYREIQASPVITTRIPAEFGEGIISRFSTPRGFSISKWEMKYNEDTGVEGRIGNGVRLLFCQGDETEWETCGKNVRLGRGEACFCLDAGAAESIRYYQGMEYSFDSVSIPYSIWEELLSDYVEEPVELLKQICCRPFSVTPIIRRCLTDFHLMGLADRGFVRMRMEAQAQLAFSLCLDEVLGESRNSRKEYGDDTRIIWDVKRAIDRSPAEAPKIPDLARRYGMSVSKLARMFKQQYGIPMHAYIIESRLCESAKLLAEGSLTIAEVAEKAGYAKGSQFSAAFKKRFGISPKDY